MVNFSAASKGPNNIFNRSSNGNIDDAYGIASYLYNVLPSVYLTSSVVISEGTGTSSGHTF